VDIKKLVIDESSYMLDLVFRFSDYTIFIEINSQRRQNAYVSSNDDSRSSQLIDGLFFIVTEKIFNSA